MDLKAKVCFTRDLFGFWVYGFGCFAGDLGLGLVLFWRLIIGEEKTRKTFN